MEKISFLFPGQGAQYVGMSKNFYENYSVAKHTFEEANEVLGTNLSKLCFEGSLLDLCRMENMFPALLTSAVASYRVYMQEIGVLPQFCAGHSLGEYSALTCSGVLKFSDALNIVRKRGEFAKEAIEKNLGSMSVIDKVSSKLIEEQCKKHSKPEEPVFVCCFNTPNQVTIAGQQNAVTRVEDSALEMGGQISPIIDSAPFHSPLMESASVKLRQELDKIEIGDFRYPVISNVTGKPYGSKENVRKLLTEQIIKPVQWMKIIKYLEMYDVSIVIDMGAMNVLDTFIAANSSKIKSYCFGEKMARKQLSEVIKGNYFVNRDRSNFITKCLAAAVSTPNYNWNNEEYENGVIKQYKKLQEANQEFEKGDNKIDEEVMISALQSLKQILDTKKVSLDEQSECIQKILEETGTVYQLKNFA